MKFDLHDNKYSEFAFIFQELSLIDNYYENIYKPDIININSILDKVPDDIDEFTFLVNSTYKYLLIKGTFLLLFSHYETTLNFYLQRINDSYEIKRNNLKNNLESIPILLKTPDLEITCGSQLYELEVIRNIMIHREGIVLDDEISSIKSLLNAPNILTFHEPSSTIQLKDDIIKYTLELINKFYKELIIKTKKINNNR
jgi:hypothetical protein